MIKICKHCGREFETNNPQKIYCDSVHYRPCPVCGKGVAMIDNDFSRPPRCCSTKCSVILNIRIIYVLNVVNLFVLIMLVRLYVIEYIIGSVKYVVKSLKLHVQIYMIILQYVLWSVGRS